MVAAVLLAGCSQPTEGVPQGSSGKPSANPDGDVVIGSPRPVGDTLDCPTLLPTSLVTQAVGLPSEVNTNDTDKTNCAFGLPAADGRPAGQASIGLVSHPQGTKTEDFEGNTAYSEARGRNVCYRSVAIKPQVWLRTHVQLLDATDAASVCPKADALLKAAFDVLPKS
jgi:hypothetical protein